MNNYTQPRVKICDLKIAYSLLSSSATTNEMFNVTDWDGRYSWTK